MSMLLQFLPRKIRSRVSFAAKPTNDIIMTELGAHCMPPALGGTHGLLKDSDEKVRSEIQMQIAQVSKPHPAVASIATSSSSSQSWLSWTSGTSTCSKSATEEFFIQLTDSWWDRAVSSHLEQRAPFGQTQAG